MSAQCHTDGYGIYMINESGKALIGTRKDADRISYQIEEGTVRICARAFRDAKNVEGIEIPASLEVIEEDSFVNTRSDLWFISHSPAIVFQDGYLLDQKRETLICYKGADGTAEVPLNIRVVAENAFQGCTIEKLVLNDTVKEIHEDALTTCDLYSVYFKAWDCLLIFPNKDIRLRQHMLDGFGKDGIFDFDRYDKDLAVGYIEEERLKMIAVRLQHPYHLSDAYQKKFYDVFDQHLDACLMALGEVRDEEVLMSLTQLGVINDGNIDHVLSVLHEQSDLTSYIAMNEKMHASMHPKEFDFEI